MIVKTNLYAEGLPWQQEAYYLAARYRQVSLAGLRLEAATFLYIEVAAGGRILPHAQPEPEWLFCMEGSATFNLDEEETTLAAGDALLVPARAVQGLLNDGPAPLRLLLVRVASATPPPEVGLLLRLLGGGIPKGHR